MNDRYKLHQFYKGKEFEIPYIEIQRFDCPKINSENISIVYLHPNYPKKGSKKEKELIENWKSVFNNLNKVKRLKINIGNQEIFNSLFEIPNLKELIIESSSIKDLTSINKFKNLTRLEIKNNSKLTDIKPITSLKLKQLLIENCFNIENYEVIGNLKTLIGLSLNGNWTAPKNLRLKSIKSYENLLNLEHLDLEYSSIIDKSYESVLKMNKLERFDILSTIKKAVRKKIKENHPNLKAGFFMDYNYEKNEFYENKNWEFQE